MIVLHRRTVAHMRLGRGGYAYSYDILDGEDVIATMLQTAKTRRTPLVTFIKTVGGKEFTSVREFIAAYEAYKLRQVKP